MDFARKFFSFEPMFDFNLDFDERRVIVCRSCHLFVSPFRVLRWFSQLWRMFPFACIRLCSPLGREGTPSLFLPRQLPGVSQFATWAWDSIHSPPVAFPALQAVRARSPLVAMNHSEPLAPGGDPHGGIHRLHTESEREAILGNDMRGEIPSFAFSTVRHLRAVSPPSTVWFSSNILRRRGIAFDLFYLWIGWPRFARLFPLPAPFHNGYPQQEIHGAHTESHRRMGRRGRRWLRSGGRTAGGGLRTAFYTPPRAIRLDGTPWQILESWTVNFRCDIIFCAETNSWVLCFSGAYKCIHRPNAQNCYNKWINYFLIHVHYYRLDIEMNGSDTVTSLVLTGNQNAGGVKFESKTGGWFWLWWQKAEHRTVGRGI